MSETTHAGRGRDEALNETVAYEPKDVNARAVLWVGVAALVAAVVIHAAVWWLFDYFDRREAQKGRPPATLVREQRPAVPAPRLQTDAPADLNGLRDAERNELESYGWLDRRKGVVHIPVERAMALLVERGLPKTQTTQANANGNGGAGLGVGEGLTRTQDPGGARRGPEQRGQGR